MATPMSRSYEFTPPVVRVIEGPVAYAHVPEFFMDLEKQHDHRFDVHGLDLFTVTLATEAGAIGTGVVTVEWSIDGVAWQAFDPAKTISAGGASTFHFDGGFAFIRFRVSTTASSQAIVRMGLFAGLARFRDNSI